MKQNKLKIIGLTGGSGAGKGETGRILSDMNAYIIDTDKISHDIILKGKSAYNEIVEHFGTGILGEDGEIVRKKLGAVVFSDKAKLERLSSITHKYVIEESLVLIARAEAEGEYSFVVIDAPLLVEAKMHLMCDRVIAVFADYELRIERIMKRDNITRRQAEKRLQSQMGDEELKTYADVAIENNGDFMALQKCLQEIVEEINQECS